VARLRPHFLSVSRFVIRNGRHGARLLARASFSLSEPLDPSASGFAFDVSASDGRALYAVVVPPEAFAAPRRRGGRLRYRVARRTAAIHAPDLRRLVVTVADDVADVRLQAVTPALARSRTETALRWVVRAGEECVSDLGLVCEEGAEQTSCS
jgi:hypothetical protein